MIRWLSRYVKQINVFGVGIELREIPEAEALPLLAEVVVPNPATEAATPGAEPTPSVQREDFICVVGVSASSKRVPRELDLMLDGEEIQLHVHAPGSSQSKIWVPRGTLQKALDFWKKTDLEEPIIIPGRTVRNEVEIVFVVDDEDEIEIQAGWWIWVPREDLKAALEELGVRAPW